MNNKEKKLLTIFLFFMVAVIVVRIVPAVFSIYEENEKELSILSAKAQRTIKLIDDRMFWNNKHKEVKDRIKILRSQVFSGDTPSLIGASVQRALKQSAEYAGITEDSMSLPEFSDIQGWLLVTQEMSFKTNDQGAILVFLQRLKESRPSLNIAEFSLRSNRRRLTGKVTVVAFSRPIIGDDSGEDEGEES